MIIHVIGSSSAGNGYVIDCDGEYLLLEAGVNLQKVMQVIGFNIRNIVGCLCSHEHGDHARYIRQYTGNGIRVYATDGTLKAIHEQKSNATTVSYKQIYNVGSYRVMPFQTEHDAAEPCGFFIECPDGRKIVFATDTYYLRYNFAKVNVFLLECNYEENILRRNLKQGVIHPKVAERVRKSHMSLSSCLSTLKASDLSCTEGIILIHMSKDNGKADYFQQKVSESCGKMTYVAQANQKYNFF